MAEATIHESNTRPYWPERPHVPPSASKSGPEVPEVGAASPQTASAFAAVLSGLGREIERGEFLVGSALGAEKRGVTLGPTELIALQAGVYRYGEAVDLTSRLVDRAASAVKTVLQGQ